MKKDMDGVSKHRWAWGMTVEVNMSLNEGKIRLSEGSVRRGKIKGRRPLGKHLRVSEV